MARAEEMWEHDSIRELAATFDGLPDGVVIVDSRMTILYANQAFCALADCDRPEELVGRCGQELLQGEDVRTAWRQLETILTAGRLRLECHLRGLKGRVVPLEAVAAKLPQEAGKEPLIIAVLRDISARKAAEETSHQSREMMRAVLDNVAVGIAIISPQMEILELNRCMREWFPDIDIGGKPICYRTFNVPPRDEVCSYCPTVKTLHDGQVHEAITDTPWYGEIIHYRVVSTALRDAEGNMVGVIEMVDDITKQKRAEDALRRSERDFRTLLEISKDAMIAVGKEGLINLFNPAAEELFGWSAEEIMGQPLDRLMPKLYRNAHQEYLRGYFETGQPNNAIGKTVELPALRRNGEIFTVELSLSATEHSGRPLVLAVLRDVTDRKKAQRALEAKNRELESFVYTASHDLRSPLVCIDGFAALLAEEYADKLGAPGQEYLERIQANVASMNALLTDLLELARIGRSEEQKEAVPVREVVDQVLADLVGMISRFDAQINIAADLPTVRYSRTRLYQVFSNLVSNAVKFCREETPPVIDIGCVARPDNYRFTVKDNGIGIQDDDLPRVFEIFSRLKDKDVEGTGIGLAIVQRIVEENGGEVGVESVPGEGSTFWFTVPISSDSPEN